jgi:hypothetical protein
MTQDCLHNSFSVDTLCSQIERERCLALPNKRQLELSLAILALLGGATIVVARVLRVKKERVVYDTCICVSLCVKF